MSESAEPPKTIWEGKYLKVVKQGTWEWVARTRGVTACVILAVDEGHVLLVEQYRTALQSQSLELPAGLVGDEEEGEDIQTAAKRELEEETGYRAERMVDLGRFHSSPGMSSEGFTLLRAEGLTKVGNGGGTASENIQVHRVKLEDVPDFVERKRGEGAKMDVKMLILLSGGFVEAARG